MSNSNPKPLGRKFSPFPRDFHFAAMTTLQFLALGAVGSFSITVLVGKLLKRNSRYYVPVPEDEEWKRG